MNELINNNEDYTVVLIPYIAEIIASSEISDAVKELQFNAILQLKARLATYRKRGYVESLLCSIARDKAAMIIRTSTSTEMGKILRPPKPYYNGNKFLADPYTAPAEELIIWSETSLLVPLNSVACDRCKELFCKYFPEQSKELL